jgi:hypothetical protein
METRRDLDEDMTIVSAGYRLVPTASLSNERTQDLIDEVTLPFCPVNAMLVDLETEGNEDDIDHIQAVRILLKAATDRIVALVRAVETKTGRIQIVTSSSSHFPRVMQPIKDVIVHGPTAPLDTGDDTAEQNKLAN